MSELDLNLKNIELLASNFDSESEFYKSLLLVAHLYCVAEEIRTARIFHEKYKEDDISMTEYRRNILNEIKEKLKAGDCCEECELKRMEYDEFICRSKSALQFLDDMKAKKEEGAVKMSIQNTMSAIWDTLEGGDRFLCYSLMKMYNYL